MESLRYPVGRFDPGVYLAPRDRHPLIDEIERAPENLRRAVSGLNETQLDTPYRDEGWTVRQVVHHIPDSHLNAYCRFKLALTEDQPRIKTYQEHLWARLPDVRITPIEVSLILLEAVQRRWVDLLRAMTDSDFERNLDHPEWGVVPLTAMLRLYEWHGRHHVAHITTLRERMRW
jgi:hypothetical protein